MAVPKLTPADVSVTLSGKVRIEGEQARILANLLVRRHDAVLEAFQKIAPTIKAEDIRLDSLGRIEIDNAKIAKIALATAQDSNLSNIGKAVAEPVADDPDDLAPPDLDFGCSDHDGGNYVDIFCIGDGGLNLACGGSDFSEDDCDVDIFCGASG